jgi:hypothetical protein
MDSVINFAVLVPERYLFRTFELMRKVLSVLFFILISCLVLRAQSVTTSDYKAYIEKYSQLAIEEMKIYRIPASITLAQGIIESNCGKSPLATEANNHFGIKCHKDWTGKGFYYDDDEKNECFRVYDKPEDSYRDHSLFLVNRPRYAALFSLDANDYTGWAYGLKQAGYATNPAYPSILIRMIEDNHLYDFDNEKPHPEIVYENAKSQEAVHITIPEARTPGVGRGLFFPDYQMPLPEEFELYNVSEEGRKVYINNQIPFIFAKEGDTWASIAREFNIYSFQVYKQNDLTEQDLLIPGQMLYLEPKKRKASESQHLVKESENMYSISQLYGVRLHLLYKYNDMKPGEEPKPGSTLLLFGKWSIF